MDTPKHIHNQNTITFGNVQIRADYFGPTEHQAQSSCIEIATGAANVHIFLSPGQMMDVADMLRSHTISALAHVNYELPL